MPDVTKRKNNRLKGLEIKGSQTFGNNHRLMGTLFFVLRVGIGTQNKS
jgi:hypothetical protein